MRRRHIIDTHDHPVCDEVWDFYREAVAYFGPVSTMIERDDNIPPLAELVEELDHARGIAQRGARRQGAQHRGARRPSPCGGGMKSLKEIQDEFQRGILAGDDAILGEVNDSSKEERKVLFGVYRNGYVARLAEILGEDYEQIHAYLGDRAFANLVRAYIAGNPSDQRSARWFGRHMPAFIAKSRTFADHPEVAELAALEKALADAFDGPDAEPLQFCRARRGSRRRLARVSYSSRIRPRSASPSRPTPQRSGPRSRMRQPRPSPRGCLSPQALLVWREGFMARFKPLSTEEAMMWDEAAKGVRFSVLCEMVATFAGEDEAELRAASYLKGWIDLGMLAGFVADPAPAPTDRSL